MLLRARADVYEALGFYKLARVDRNVAIENYKEVARQKPNGEYDYTGLGTRFEDNGQLRLAIAQYTLAIEHRPKYPYAYEKRAKAYEKLGNIQEAFADYQKSIELDPLNAGDALESRARMLMAMGRLDEALADITTAITPDPRFSARPPYPPFVNARADIYLAMKKPQEAITDYTSVIEAGRGELLTYFGRGNAYERIGSSRLAAADYRKCLEVPGRNEAQRQVQRQARMRLKALSYHR